MTPIYAISSSVGILTVSYGKDLVHGNMGTNFTAVGPLFSSPVCTRFHKGI